MKNHEIVAALLKIRAEGRKAQKKKASDKYNSTSSNRPKSLPKRSCECWLDD